MNFTMKIFCAAMINVPEVVNNKEINYFDSKEYYKDILKLDQLNFKSLLNPVGMKIIHELLTKSRASFGCYTCLNISFDLRSIISTPHRFNYIALNEVILICIQVYLNDIRIYSISLEDYSKYIGLVLVFYT